jgi:hypothetical protein
MIRIHLQAAWIAMWLGCVAGAIQGLFFHSDGWLGGYGSWQRRMLRLGHIAFFGLGFINLAFGLSLFFLAAGDGLWWTSRLLLFGLAAMPLVCYASAVVKPLRHLFGLPALSVILALGLLAWRLVR